MCFSPRQERGCNMKLCKSVSAAGVSAGLTDGMKTGVWGDGGGGGGQWIETSNLQPLQSGDLARGSHMPRAQTLEQSGEPNVFPI